MRCRLVLGKLPLARKANAAVKTRQLECLAVKELAKYRAVAGKRGVHVPEGTYLKQALLKRLANRGIQPRPKAGFPAASPQADRLLC